jgi:hypothetical protein
MTGEETAEARLKRYRELAAEARSRAARASVSDEDGYARLAEAWTQLAEEVERLMKTRDH